MYVQTLIQVTDLKLGLCCQQAWWPGLTALKQYLKPHLDGIYVSREGLVILTLHAPISDFLPIQSTYLYDFSSPNSNNNHTPKYLFSRTLICSAIT